MPMGQPSLFSRQFESAQQSIVAAGALTLAHSLGVQPKLYCCVLQCVTADAGYAIGDEIGPLSLETSSPMACRPDATNLNVRTIDTGFAVFYPHKTTGVSTNLVATRWRYVFRAWA